MTELIAKTFLWSEIILSDKLTKIQGIYHQSHSSSGGIEAN